MKIRQVVQCWLEGRPGTATTGGQFYTDGSGLFSYGDLIATRENARLVRALRDRLSATTNRHLNLALDMAQRRGFKVTLKQGAI